MSHVWICLPSARTDGGTIPLFQKAGYRVSVWRDPGKPIPADICICQPYPGFALAANAVIHAAMLADPEAQWLVNVGDDIDPDPHDPEQIARECTEHFGGTFGVMQPVGDKWLTSNIEKICGSPWMGREFCQRAYGGKGPFWKEYWHMHVDEELLCVTIKLGVLWQRKDLLHYHHHWMRETPNDPPAFLARANSGEHWNESREIFRTRKSAGFPGHEPL